MRWRVVVISPGGRRTQRQEGASARDGAPQNRRAGAPGHALGRRPRDARRPPVHSAPVAAQECRHGSECREAHADFGTSGRAQTVAALDRAGIAHTGFPSEITCLRANGIRVAFLGFAPYAFDANPLDYAGALALVRRARRHAAIVVVIIHAGAEGADQLHTPTVRSSTSARTA